MQGTAYKECEKEPQELLPIQAYIPIIYLFFVPTASVRHFPPETGYVFLQFQFRRAHQCKAPSSQPAEESLSYSGREHLEQKAQRDKTGHITLPSYRTIGAGNSSPVLIIIIALIIS